MEAAIVSNRRKVTPFGLKGSKAGLPGRNYVIREDGSREQLEGTDTVEVNSGDIVVIETPGGGGYGKVDS